MPPSAATYPALLFSLHVSVILSGVLYFVGGAIALVSSPVLAPGFDDAPPEPSIFGSFYTVCLGCAAASYLYSLYLAHGMPRRDPYYLQSMMMNSNTQYCLITFVFLFRPTAAAIRTFMPLLVMFSVFAVSAAASNMPTLASVHPLAQRIGAQAGAAQVYVCYWEVFILANLFIEIFTTGSLLSFLMFGHFMTFRYQLDPTTRGVWDSIGGRCDVWVEANCPAGVKTMYTSVRQFIWKMANRRPTAHAAPRPHAT